VHDDRVKTVGADIGGTLSQYGTPRLEAQLGTHRVLDRMGLVLRTRTHFLSILAPAHGSVHPAHSCVPTTAAFAARSLAQSASPAWQYWILLDGWRTDRGIHRAKFFSDRLAIPIQEEITGASTKLDRVALSPLAVRVSTLPPHHDADSNIDTIPYSMSAVFPVLIAKFVF
jgi:hypothetical protein